MQAADPNETPKVGDTSGLSFTKKLAKEATIDFTDLAKAIEQTYNIQVKLNAAFGQGQERLSEMTKTISDAIPRIARLGGDIGDVQTTMIGIAEASRRNVISNTEDIEKLYAATKVVGGSAEELSNSFLDVGIGIGEVGEQLESSVNYIRSIGGNTSAVMKDVRNNMNEMNRYQFEGGVAGLTKMAAQASMLRFDMSNTFALAEKVITPDGAIEVASAFQRLGVASGNLVDPFRLMNLSLTDPSGLQDSLAEVSKQFTYFDEETKSFKINPQGVLTLREMENAAGLAQGSLSKMGLAAAELDERLSVINVAGLNIASEEDKQYLANIATMKDGKYMVTLEDDTKKELSELTQPEFDRLIEQQKTGPKTLEDIAKLQLGIDEDILANMQSMNRALTQGLTSARPIRKGIAATQRVVKTTLGETSDAIRTEDFRQISEGIIDGFKVAAQDIISGNVSPTDIFDKGLEKLSETLTKAQDLFTKKFEIIGENIVKKLNPEDKKMMESTIGSVLGNSQVSLSPQKFQTKEEKLIENKTMITSNQTNSSKVDVSGKIEFDFTGLPAGVSSGDVAKMIDKSYNSQGFQQYISNITNVNNSKQPVSTSYSA
jgi:hypothetical protein